MSSSPDRYQTQPSGKADNREFMKEYNSSCHLSSVVMILCRNTVLLLQFGDFDSAKVLIVSQECVYNGRGTAILCEDFWKENAKTTVSQVTGPLAGLHLVFFRLKTGLNDIIQFTHVHLL